MLCGLGTNGAGHFIDFMGWFAGNRFQTAIRIFEVSHFSVVRAFDIFSCVIIKFSQCHGFCGTDIRLIYSVDGFTALCCENRHRDCDEYTDDGDYNQKLCEREAFLSVHISIPFIGHAT